MAKNLSHLFTFEDNPIKFFIQDDLGDNLKNELQNDIETHGGTVFDKVPQRGYILVEAGSDDGKRLIKTYRKPDKPERFFVPYSFIRTCLRAGKVISQIFIVDGRPLDFHIHQNVENIYQNQKARERILVCGGNPDATAEQARIIIADPKAPDWRALVRSYEKKEFQFVESPSWIKQCIDNGKYENTAMVQKNLGGRIAGSVRNEYTDKEDRQLAHYIARRIPFKSMNGRTGNKIYQDLADRGRTEQGYEWALRHTWQSWLNRYKKHMPRIDTMIDAYVTEHDIRKGAKGQYGFVTKTSGLRSASVDDDESETPYRSPEVLEAPQGNQISTRSQARMISPEIPPYGSDPAYFNNAQSDASQEQAQSPGPYQNQHSQDASEWGSQWPIRHGTNEPPQWAQASGSKRLRGQEIATEASLKRSRLAQFPDAVEEEEGQLMKESIEEELGRRLAKIASDYRWNIEEVWEEYNNLGKDLEATRDSILEFRELIEERKRLR